VWKSLSNENWNGFTLGIIGLAEDVPSGQPCDERTCERWERNSVTGRCDYFDLECSSDECNDGVCNPVTGGCELEPKTTVTHCDDENPCTEYDTCYSGECRGTYKACPTQEGQCGTAVCNPNTGGCDPIPKDDYEDCEDGNPCTQGDTCQGGVCQSGKEISCVSENPCKENGVCVDGGCEYDDKADDSACEDTDACTIGDFCQDGVCISGSPKTCPEPDQCLQPGTCNSITGQCEYEKVEDGTFCEDGNACTGDDTCQSGKCVTGAKKICCRTNGANGKCGLCVHDCGGSAESVLMFFGLRGSQKNVCGGGGNADCEIKTDVCCAPKDQDSTIDYLPDGSCYHSAY